MGTFTNSDDPDEMPHYKCHIMRHFMRVYTVKIDKIIRQKTTQRIIPSELYQVGRNKPRTLVKSA